jgi:hypothetical protein
VKREHHGEKEQGAVARGRGAPVAGLGKGQATYRAAVKDLCRVGDVVPEAVREVQAGLDRGNLGDGEDTEWDGDSDGHPRDGRAIAVLRGPAGQVANAGERHDDQAADHHRHPEDPG